MSGYRLNELEMRAIEYYISNPELDDRVMCKLLSLKRNELRKLKARIFSRVLQQVVIPNYAFLGWELMYVVHGTPTKSLMNCAHDLKQKARFQQNFTHLYLAPNFFIGIGFARNYTALLREYEQLCISGTFSMESTHLIIFPNELITHLCFFDYTSLLGQSKAQPLQFENNRITTPQGNLCLEPLERRILYALAQKPSASDREIARTGGTTVELVKRKRRMLQIQDVFYLRNIPDLEVLGYAGFAFYAMQIKHGRSKDAMRIIRRVCDVHPVFFCVSDANNAVFMCAIRTMDEVFEQDVALRTIISGEDTGMTKSMCTEMLFSEVKALCANDFAGILQTHPEFIFGEKLEDTTSEPERR